MAEFALIQRYFSGLSRPGQDVLLGIGDDCALLQPPAGQQLATTMDTLIAGCHFLPDADPVSVGHKSLAVNLSDLAAMGATPAWALLSLSMPRIDDDWLQGFVRGFRRLAGQFGVQLVGGDTCQGPLSITLQLTGFLEAEKAMLRANAKPGDLVCVTGTLGDAALALRLLQAGEDPGGLRARLETPLPRVDEGRMLADLGVRTCIDISDGLVADLGHICERSSCAARIEVARLPLSSAFRGHAGDPETALAGGDDYELCFTLPPSLQPELEALPFDITCIGEIQAGQGVELVDETGNSLALPRGWEHFSS
ncbi:thiamine-phosphate kinase [Thiolapillus sp.]|uniref:thiamine-phosphate kinase n=1 Tax=Thiolapillus sp. TaxID=2017437 RepID=UPI0025E85683